MDGIIPPEVKPGGAYFPGRQSPITMEQQISPHGCLAACIGSAVRKMQWLVGDKLSEL